MNPPFLGACDAVPLSAFVRRRLMSKTALFADPLCKKHDTGTGHPESPRRFDAAMDGLKNAGLLDRLTRIEGRAVGREDFALVHTPDYLALAEGEISSGEVQLSTGDTVVCAAPLGAAARRRGLTRPNAVDAGYRAARRQCFLHCASARTSCHAGRADGLLPLQ